MLNSIIIFNKLSGIFLKANLPDVKFNNVKKFCLLFLMFLLSSGTYAQDDKALKKSVYSFLNIYLKTNEKKNYKIDLNLIPFKTNFLDLNQLLDERDFNETIASKINFDTVLTAEDVKFMKKQLVYWNDTRELDVTLLNINPNHILEVNKSPAKKVLFPDYTTWKVALPLFSLHKDVAMLYIEKYCGLDCGEGELILFKKTDNIWKIISVKSIWLS